MQSKRRQYIRTKTFNLLGMRHNRKRKAILNHPVKKLFLLKQVELFFNLISLIHFNEKRHPLYMI